MKKRNTNPTGFNAFLLEKMKRPQGLTREEMKACLRKEGRDPRHYGGALNYLYEMCGYDIRKASVSEERDQETFREFGFSNFQKVNGRNPHKPVLYRCIGRFRWNGGYDCYLTDEELVRFTLEDQIEK